MYPAPAILGHCQALISICSCNATGLYLELIMRILSILLLNGCLSHHFEGSCAASQDGALHLVHGTEVVWW